MSSSLRDRHGQLLVAAVLDRYDGLRIVPSRGDDLRLVGTLAFSAVGPDQEAIDDEYFVEIVVASDFPERIPSVRERGGRIAPDFHKLQGGALCLGAPTALRLKLSASPTLLTFVERILIPYLYGHSYFLKHGKMPFGELDHGDAGIRAELGAIFGARNGSQPEEFLRLSGLQKRRANRELCPCGSRIRLGRCHNRCVNNFRARMGRLWCRDEYTRVLRGLVSRRPSTGSLFSFPGPRGSAAKIST